MKNDTIIMKIEHGSLVTYDSSQRTLLNEFVGSLVDGDSVQVKMKHVRTGKTWPQLGYWYAVIIPFAMKGFLECGQDSMEVTLSNGLKLSKRITKDDIDAFLKELYAESISYSKAINKRTMNIEDMRGMIDFAANFIAENFGIVCPSTDFDTDPADDFGKGAK